MFCKITYCLP
jgi:trypsin